VIVVDTNVLAYLLLPGGRGAVAEQVLERDPRWAAPLLLRSEFRSVLAGWVRRGALSMDKAVSTAMDAEEYVRGHEYSVPARDVLELVARSSCTAYDCEFVALARNLRSLLVTSDRQVLAAFPETAISPEAFVAR
jgi:predicted nucleic acid-binding protein